MKRILPTLVLFCLLAGPTQARPHITASPTPPAPPKDDISMLVQHAPDDKGGLKCGRQACEPMRRIRFEDVDIVQTLDRIDLMCWDGFGAWQDSSLKGIRMEEIECRRISPTVREEGSSAGVRFENLHFAEPRPGFFRGQAATQRIAGIVSKNLWVAGRPVGKLEAVGITTIYFVAPVTFAEYTGEKSRSYEERVAESFRDPWRSSCLLLLEPWFSDE